MAHYLWRSLLDVHVARLSSATLDQPERFVHRCAQTTADAINKTTANAHDERLPHWLQMDEMDEPFHSPE